MARSRFFRAGEWTFTWRRAPEGGARVDMWREDPSGRLHWVANAASRGGERARVHATALAMIAWVRSLDVRARADAQATAVAERIACAADRMSRARAANHDVAVRLAVTRLLRGEAAAA
ncbi:MAG: hypothetical protein R3A52_20315 [Polyangiales bacterium]